MSQTWVITGASGFIGQHLIRRLNEAGEKVVAWSRKSDHGRSIDLLDPEAVAAAMAEDQPDIVIHLSAQSLPGVSWQDPVGTYNANILGAINVVQGLAAQAPRARLVNVSSSSIYAPKPGGESIREDDALQGASPYAVSKMAQETTARLMGERAGLAVVTVRPFFVIGAEKTGDVCSDFARRVVAAEVAGGGTLKVGNLDAVRDFVDIRDAVEAFVLLAERGEPGGVYNLCSGQGWAIRDVVEAYRGMARAALSVEVDPDLVRPLDEPVKVGDPSRLKALGWSPTVSMTDSLAAILAYWREMGDVG